MSHFSRVGVSILANREAPNGHNFCKYRPIRFILKSLLVLYLFYLVLKYLNTCYRCRIVVSCRSYDTYGPLALISRPVIGSGA
jgi:hypothetical protein